MSEPTTEKDLYTSLHEQLADIYALIRQADEAWGVQDGLEPEKFEGLSLWALALDNFDGMPGGWSWRLK